MSSKTQQLGHLTLTTELRVWKPSHKTQQLDKLTIITQQLGHREHSGLQRVIYLLGLNS